MRTKRVERLLVMMQTVLSGRTVTAADLAALTGVTRRTIYRDVGPLQRCGVPIAFDRSTGKYAADRESLLPPVSLTHAEALSLLLASRLLLDGRLLPYPGSAAAAALKLESMLPAALRDHCGPVLERMTLRLDPASSTASIVDTMSALQAAMIRRSAVRVRYDSYFERAVIDVTLYPYHLAFMHRGWYLIAYSERHRMVRMFKVERVVELQTLDFSFEADPDFNLDAYFGNAWLMIRGDRRYAIKVRFLPQVAANVEEIAWHKTQTTYYEDDGSLIFTAQVDGFTEVGWWVLGYGDQAHVLEPPELRAFVAGHARRMSDHYNGQAAPPGIGDP